MKINIQWFCDSAPTTIQACNNKNGESQAPEKRKTDYYKVTRQLYIVAEHLILFLERVHVYTVAIKVLLSVIGMSLSEPHTSMLNSGFSYIVIIIIYLPYVRCSVNAS